MSVGSLGGKGVLLFVLALFPQILLYVPVYLGLLELGPGGAGSKRWKRALIFFCLFILLHVGILLESSVNPLILNKILNFN
jgi:hypothetical protein